MPEAASEEELWNIVEVQLPQQLGLQLQGAKMAVERVYQVGVLKPAADRPRPVIARIFNFAEKHRFMTLYQGKHTLEYKGKSVLLLNDYSVRVTESHGPLFKSGTLGYPICPTIPHPGLGYL